MKLEFRLKRSEPIPAVTIRNGTLFFNRKATFVLGIWPYNCRCFSFEFQQHGVLIIDFIYEHKIGKTSREIKILDGQRYVYRSGRKDSSLYPHNGE